MPTSPGTRLGPYEVVAKIGEGGMGEVYRATDLHLKRQVALKVLPAALAGDAERLARFQREAEVLAALNHPNIAAIYGLEKTPDVTALVMELVEGEDLSAHIARGPMPLTDVLPIARQIAEALEAAHERGIIHRDLKPQNIKVREDGTIKVLDFGLAKAVEQGTAAGERAAPAADSPTITTPAMTMRGMILGTAAYMSPEQARGKVVDRRADIWAFGVVLYEMLSGRRAFEGEELSDVLAAVLRQDVDMTALPPNTPEAIRRLLARCLRRDTKQRLADASTIRLDIDQALTEPETSAPSRTPAPAPRTSAMLLAACGGLALTLTMLAVVHFREPVPVPPPEMRLDIVTPATTWASDFELSPDGRSIAFVAPGEKPGISYLWVRRLDRSDAQMLAGTDDARWPFWAPDSRSIAYTARGTLRRIDATGGASIKLAESVGTAQGGAWNADGVILFRDTDGLYRVSASGGQAAKLVSSEGLAPRFPQFLPDGRHFVYFVYTGSGQRTGLYLASLDAPTPTFLGPSVSTARWLPPDRLLLVEQGKLVARQVDLGRGEFVGNPHIVADGLSALDTSAGHGGFSASTQGLVVYRPQMATSESHLEWRDRTGAPAGAPIDLAGRVSALEVSPDGTRLAVDLDVNGNRDVWIRDLERGSLTRVTFDAAVDGYPVWSPDGRTIAFESGRKGGFDLFAKSSSGAGSEEVWLEKPGNQWPYGFSRDGTLLLYYSGANAGDLMALPLAGSPRTPIAIATTPFQESQGALSPDGKWVAYTTSESGRPEVVVQAFPAASGKWQASAGGGVSPRWSVDGRELYFVAGEILMAASIRAVGNSLDVAPPVKLFAVGGSPGGGPAPPQYAVDRRGRFLVNNRREAAVTTPITLLLNWRPDGR